MRRSTQIAIFSGAGLGPVEKTVTGNAPLTISDAVTDSIKALTIYGHTESGASVGDNGLTVTSCGKNLFNINGNVNVRHSNPNNIGDEWIEDTSQTKNTVENGVLIAYYDNSTSWGSGQLIQVKSNTHYKISWVNTSFGTGTGATIRVEHLKDSSSAAYYPPYFINTDLNVRVSKDFVSDEHTLVLLSFMSKDGHNAQFTDIQIEEGTTVTGYSPYTDSTATITTALPLRSNGNVKDELNYPTNKVITRIDSNGDVLDTPVETALSASEIAALQSLNTYEGTTNIFVTDDPSISVTYMSPRTTTRTTKKRTTRKKK